MFSSQKQNSASSQSAGQLDDNIVIRTMNSDLRGEAASVLPKDEAKESGIASSENPMTSPAAEVTYFTQSNTPNSPNPFANNLPQINLAPETPAVPPASPIIEMAPEESQFQAPSQQSETFPPQDSGHNPFLDQDEVITSEGASEIPSGLSWGKILIFALSLLIIVTLGIGGYYFWVTREEVADTAPIEDIPPVVPVTPEPEEPIIPEPEELPTSKYSDKNPNYLAINTENSKEVVQKQLQDLTAEVVGMNTTTPVEFVITDDKNVPLSFKIFALATGIKMAPDVLSQLETDFSLYIAKNGGDSRAVLAVDLANPKNAINLATLLKTKEKTLVPDLAPLFLGKAAEQTTKPFSDGKHKNYAIRYTNVNAANTLSIDYTLTSTQLVIGTSKDSIRAALDKIDAESQVLDVSSASGNITIEKIEKLPGDVE